jgi:hypothetical protein
VHVWERLPVKVLLGINTTGRQYVLALRENNILTFEKKILGSFLRSSVERQKVIAGAENGGDHSRSETAIRDVRFQSL